jgi:hypothetical protein
MNEQFCFRDEDENSYFLKWAKTAYRGEDLEFMLYKKTPVEEGEFTEENITGSFTGKLYDNNNNELTKEGEKFIIPYARYTSMNLNMIPLKLYVPTDQNYLDAGGNQLGEGSYVNIQVTNINMQSVAKIDASENGNTFSIDDKDRGVVNAPSVIFANGVDPDDYKLIYIWNGAQSIEDGKKAIVRRNYTQVSCSVSVYRKFIDESGEENWYHSAVSNLNAVYKDRTAYENVKLAEFEKDDNTYSWWLLYAKDNYNGEDVIFRYAVTEGTEYDPEKTVSGFQPTFNNVYLTIQNEEEEVLRDSEYLNSTNGKSSIPYRNFVENKGETSAYPQGEKKYFLSFNDGAKIGDAVITGVKEITLNWELPGTIEKKEGIREIVARSSEYLTVPQFTAYEAFASNSYATYYQWFYRSAKNGEWQKKSSSNSCAPDKNGYYLCQIRLVKGYSNPIWTDEQEYHVSLVEVSPIKFYGTEGNGQAIEETVHASAGQSLTLEPDAQIADGYTVKWQWYKNGKILDGQNGSKLFVNSLTDEDFAEYKLIGEAYLEGETLPCYQASYTAMVEKNDAFFFEKKMVDGEASWSGTKDVLTLYRSIGDTVKEQIPLVTREGYTAEYQWYARKWMIVDDYYRYDEKEGINVVNEDYSDWECIKAFDRDILPEEGGTPIGEKTYYILTKYELMKGENGAGLNQYKLSEEDFLHSFDIAGKKETFTTEELLEIEDQYMFMCRVSITGPQDYEKTFEKYLNIKETWDFAELYTAGKSESQLKVQKGADLTIVAPQYGIEEGYQVLYKWQKKEYTAPEEYEWKDLKEATGNTLSLEKIEEACEYRVTVFPARAGSDVALGDAEAVYTYEISLDEKKGIERVSATTNTQLRVKLGDSVKMGVEAKLCRDSSEDTLLYQWYLNGEELENASKAEYTISKVGVGHFGTYECKVTAVDASEEVIDSKTVRFYVRENTGIKISSPTSNVVVFGKVGEKISLEVVAESENGEKLTYSWYRTERDNKSADYGKTVKIVGQNTSKYEITPGENDFTDYYCRVMNSRGQYENRTFSLLNEELINAVSAKNGVTLFDKKPGDSVELAVVSTAETNGGTFTYQWYKGEEDEELLKIGGATKPVLSFEKLEEDQFDDYQCDWKYVKDDRVLATGTVTFTINRIAEKVTDIFESVTEYGEASNGGRNRIGDHVRFGVMPAEGNRSAYTYEWYYMETGVPFEGGKKAIIAEPAVPGMISAIPAGEKEIFFPDIDIVIGGTPRRLDNTNSVFEISSLSKEDFGTYYLSIYDKDGKAVNPYDKNGKRIKTTFNLSEYVKSPKLTLDEHEEEIKAKPGEDLTLSVSASADSTEPITYQWYKYIGDGYEAIYKATASTYPLNSLKENDFTGYCVMVRCGDSSARKYINVYKTANLNVNHTVLPTDGEYRYYEKKNPGDPVTFTVDASADPEFEVTYQWYRLDEEENLERIPGAVSKDYEIKTVGEEDYGDYQCVVKAGADEERVSFTLGKTDEFLNLVRTDENGELVILTEENEKDYYTERFYVKAGDKITLKPDVRTSAKAVEYQWYRFDKIQNKYVELTGETGKTLEVTVTEEDIEKDGYLEKKAAPAIPWEELIPIEEELYWNPGNYKCVISSSFRTIEYRAKFYAQGEEDDELLVASMGAFVDEDTYGMTAAGNRKLSGAASDLTGYALENAPIKLVVTDRKKGSDRTYQWYVGENGENYKKIEGMTGSEYSFRAPMVDRAVPGDGRKQNEMQSTNYICAAIEKGKIVDRVCYTLYSIKVPEVLNQLPKAYRYGNETIVNGESTGEYNIKGYCTANAKSQTFQFAPNYEKKSSLIIFDRNGNFAVYGANQEIAGKSIKVDTDLAVMFYFETVWEAETSMAEIAEMVAKGKSHGYAAASVKAATNAGGTVSNKTVTPNLKQNPVKTLKAKNKKVSVKAGKTVVLTFKVTAQDKSAKPTDEPIVKLSGKAAKKAKVVKTTVSAKTVKVKIKTNKKKTGAMKVKLTMGNKKATVTVTVK